ncbi:MAG: aminoacetone oxidase family FAD-binding enzyme [bacterium]|nr:aminoacetone oxidase family FAD-binding enzyme [bacterium]
MSDIIIIGGGASGIATAIMTKQRCPKCSVTVLESQDRILKKLLVTGNGQCNISNKNCSIENYHGEDITLASNIINQFDYRKQVQFFDSLGLPIVFEQSGKGYPMSYQAAAVVDTLRFKVEELGIKLHCNCEVLKVDKVGKIFNVYCKEETFQGCCVVIACGGEAGGKLGSKSGYTLFKNLGHKINQTNPSIVQLKSDSPIVKQLKGVKVNALCKITQNNRTQRSQAGEVLFCDYGLSGPAVLQLSRVASLNKNCTVKIDFLPETTENQLFETLRKRKSLLQTRFLADFLTGMLNKRLGQVIIKQSQLGLQDLVSSLSDRDMHTITHNIKNLCFSITGTTGMANAQVTAGGASLKQFSCDTLMSKKINGLFACGEVLDVDGDCGGFNLAWCWACANAVSKGIQQLLKETLK